MQVFLGSMPFATTNPAFLVVSSPPLSVYFSLSVQEVCCQGEWPEEPGGLSSDLEHCLHLSFSEEGLSMCPSCAPCLAYLGKRMLLAKID